LLNLCHSFHNYDVDAPPASSTWTRPWHRHGADDRRCPGLGSAGLALGGVTFLGAQLGEESGTRHRPGSSLVAVTWATIGAEKASLRGGGISAYQRGGRARSPLHSCVGHRV
jgi:hypothetical protein